MTAEKRKRVLVTVSPEMYELVHALGTEANVATSQLLGEMIEEARPAFEAMLLAVRQAKKNQVEAYDTLHIALINAQREASDLQLAIYDEKKEPKKKRLRKIARLGFDETKD